MKIKIGKDDCAFVFRRKGEGTTVEAFFKKKWMMKTALLHTAQSGGLLY